MASADEELPGSGSLMADQATAMVSHIIRTQTQRVVAQKATETKNIQDWSLLQDEQATQTKTSVVIPININPAESDIQILGDAKSQEREDGALPQVKRVPNKSVNLYYCSVKELAQHQSEQMRAPRRRSLKSIKSKHGAANSKSTHVTPVSMDFQLSIAQQPCRPLNTLLKKQYHRKSVPSCKESAPDKSQSDGNPQTQLLPALDDDSLATKQRRKRPLYVRVQQKYEKEIMILQEQQRATAEAERKARYKHPTVEDLRRHAAEYDQIKQTKLLEMEHKAVERIPTKSRLLTDSRPRILGEHNMNDAPPAVVEKGAVVDEKAKLPEINRSTDHISRGQSHPDKSRRKVSDFRNAESKTPKDAAPCIPKQNTEIHPPPGPLVPDNAPLFTAIHPKVEAQETETSGQAKTSQIGLTQNSPRAILRDGWVGICLAVDDEEDALAEKYEAGFAVLMASHR